MVVARTRHTQYKQIFYEKYNIFKVIITIWETFPTGICGGRGRGAPWLPSGD